MFELFQNGKAIFSLRYLEKSNEKNTPLVCHIVRDNLPGRNRVVPIPGFVKKEIEMIDRSKSEFLFGTSKGPYNRDYFNTLWSRYKNQSEFDLTNVTPYSFRHTGAINVFEKTGSIQKVKEIMGHSNIQVSLIYLRGIEVSSLSVQDMPDLIL